MSSKRRDFTVIPETAERGDLESLRGAISSALTRFPIDEPSLREAVWTYADAELRLGTTLGYVIVVITELADTASIAPFSVRSARTRQLTLWTIERYFGNSGAADANGTGDPNVLVRPSRRSTAR